MNKFLTESIHYKDEFGAVHEDETVRMVEILSSIAENDRQFEDKEEEEEEKTNVIGPSTGDAIFNIENSSDRGNGKEHRETMLGVKSKAGSPSGSRQHKM